MQSFSSLNLAVVKQGLLPVANLILKNIFLYSKLSSFSIGFNNTNVDPEWALLKPVRATDYVLCTTFLLFRIFVPQKESFENIKVYSIFNKSKLS